jgi:hypothetical protein
MHWDVIATPQLFLLQIEDAFRIVESSWLHCITVARVRFAFLLFWTPVVDL